LSADPVQGGAPESGDEIDWDVVVDLICVGPGDTAAAVAVAAEDAGLDVWLTGRMSELPEAASLADRLGMQDAPTRDYLDSLTEDTGPLATADTPADLSHRREADQAGPPYHFYGARLRDWAVSCLASPYGVLMTKPAAAGAPALAADATADMAEQDVDGVLDRLVFSANRVVGAVLETSTGPVWVSAPTVVLATGPGTPLPAGVVGELALSTYPDSRFARLEVSGQ